MCNSFIIHWFTIQISFLNSYCKCWIFSLPFLVCLSVSSTGQKQRKCGTLMNSRLWNNLGCNLSSKWEELSREAWKSSWLVSEAKRGRLKAGLKTRNWFLGLFGVFSVCLRVMQSASSWEGWLYARLRVRRTLSWC